MVWDFPEGRVSRDVAQISSVPEQLPDTPQDIYHPTDPGEKKVLLKAYARTDRRVGKHLHS